MAHNSKRNRRHTTVQDGDDYVYPTKKVREHKTRSRKYDKHLIKVGLADVYNIHVEDHNEYLDGGQAIIDYYNQMVKEFNEAEEEAKQDRENYDNEAFSDSFRDFSNYEY